jgi:ketosteroid isomerase-like protein
MDTETLIRTAYQAYAAGDIATMLAAVDTDLEWTYLDPGVEDPQPQVCCGRDELAVALRRQAERGLKTHLVEVLVNGEEVMVGLHTPGADAYRVRRTGDVNYDVLTVRDGRIVAIRACRDRAEALAVAGIS